MLSQRFGLDIFSRYRAQLMGFAILWIMFYHMHGVVSDIPILQPIQYTAYSGVDIFLFVSGMGLFFSLSKKWDVRSFYRRRFQRILPAWFFILVVHTLVFTLFSDMKSVFYRAFFLYWYMPAIALFYLAAPWLYRWLLGEGKVHWRRLILILIGVAVLQVGVYAARIGQNLVVLMVPRIPSFVLGLVAGKLIADRRSVPLLPVLVLFVVGCLLFQPSPSYTLAQKCSGLPFYPALFVIPCIAYLISLACRWLPGLSTILSGFGKYTLELYLAHQFVFKVMPDVCGIESVWLWVLVTLPIAFIIHWFTNLCTRWANKD